MNEDEVREVVANYRANNMPLDAVVLDIDYMERYKDFTVDAQRFPRFADFAAETFLLVLAICSRMPPTPQGI